MSMYGESHYAEQKNSLYDEISKFLEEHPASELLQIVTDAIRDIEEEKK